MLKKARLRVAESIKAIQKPDDWQWKRWLKKPDTSKVSISMIKVDVVEENLFKSDLSTPKIHLRNINIFSRGLVDKKQFDRWLRIKATKSKIFVIQIPKTNRVFYNVVKTKISENLIPSDELTTFKFSSDFKNLFTRPNITKVEILEKIISTYQKFYHEDLIKKEFRYSWNYSSQKIDYFNHKDKWEIHAEKISENDKRLEKFFAKTSEVTKNLLPTSKDCNFIGERTISKFYFSQSKITGNLLPTSSYTYDVTLLNLEKFETNVSDLHFIILQNKLGESDSIIQSVLLLRNPASEIGSIEVKELPKVRVSKNINTTIHLKTKKAYLYKPELNKIPDIHTFRDQKFDVTKPTVYEQDLSLINSLTPTEKPNLTYESQQFDGLYKFQNNGIDFLINHPFAVIGDEHGLGKTVQVVNSINFLCSKKRIKTVLILSTSTELGNSHLFANTKNSEGWDGHFINWTPNLQVKLLLDGDPNRNKKWKEQGQVFISSYSEFKKDYESGTFAKDFFKKFDCIILDELYNVKATSILKKCLTNIKPKYFWAISAILKKDFEKEFKSNLQGLYCEMYNKKLNDEEWEEFYISCKLYRTLLEEKKELPDRIYHNKWFKLAEEQIKEHEGIIQEGEVTIYSTIERGNYYIVRPQIFNILHQLKQISNFSSHELYSSKAKELLSFIQSTDEKIVVFSQYEKSGLDRLEKLFTTNNLSFVSYKTGMMEAALEKSITEFRNDKVQIFLADVKAIQKKINLGTLSTIIHFDHWWNPNAVWQLEDKVDFGIKKNPTNVYYYWTEGTVEEKIYSKLTERGLFYKNIFDSLSITSVADLISVEEWLEMFNIKVEDSSDLKVSKDIISKTKLVETLNQDELRELTKKFLLKLGFGSTKFLKYDDNNADDVSLTTKIVNNKEDNLLVLIRSTKETNLNTISNFLNSFSDYRKISKTFIITSGKFKSDCRKFFSFTSNSFTLIDGTLLANILSQFNLI